MRVRSLTLATLGAIALMGSTLPAFSQEWRERHEWRGHEWREHEWREHHGWGPGYYAPPVVVAPPAYGYYAPPPTYYAPPAPGVSLGFTFR